MTTLQDELGLDREAYERLAAELASAESPVGIDAKKTHVFILHLLLDLQQRLGRLEAQLGPDRVETP
ncbi:MAG: hypothetical protein ACK41D_07555 [Rubricoccaceae bacterium]